MSSKNDDTTKTSPSEQNAETLLSPESSPKKTKSKSNKAQLIDLPPSPTGLEDTKSQLLSASEKKPSSKRKKQGSEMPVPKLAESRERVKAAMARLGVDPEEVENAPEITPLLKEAEGGLKYVLSCFRFSLQNETIRKFIDKYDSIPSGDRERLPWEAVVLAADLDFETFMGAAMFAIANFSSNKSKIILASSHPKITRARITFGLMAGGEKDRFAIDTMVGALPSPKGPTFIGKAIFGGAAQAATEKDDDEDGPTQSVFVDSGDLDALFPPSGDIQEKLVPIRQKLLNK